MSYKYGRQFCCITRPSSCTLNVHNLNRGTWDMNWHHKRPFLIIAKCLPSLVESYGQYGRTHSGRFSQPVELINPQSVLELQSWSLWQMYVQLPSCIPGVPWLEDWANPALLCSLRGHCSKPSVDWWKTLPGDIFWYPLLMRGLKPGISDHGLSALGIPAPRKGLVPTWLTCFRSSAMQPLKLRWMLGDTSCTLGKFDENLDQNCGVKGSLFRFRHGCQYLWQIRIICQPQLTWNYYVISKSQIILNDFSRFQGE